MATFASFLSCSPLPHPSRSHLASSRLRPLPPSLPFSVLLRPTNLSANSRRRSKSLVFALSAPVPNPSSDDFKPNIGSSPYEKSVLANLVQEIEPLDVSLIQKDVPPPTVDAMKRTVSGMLGLLPSDRFEVLIEALWEPLSKLLISSMMTGYTLRNAEYRLCFERNFDMHEGSIGKEKTEDSKLEAHEGASLDNNIMNNTSSQDELPKSEKTNDNTHDIAGLGEMRPEALQYILNLKSRLSSVRKELCEVKRKSAALQMQQFVGEEKNDLLDYLRSLRPEKVAELSEPTSPELKETIHSVVHGLLATLSPKMQSKAPHLTENNSPGTVHVGIEEDSVDLVENTSLQFHPLLSLSRDYLARLLFWCMLLGHYLRGLEYRLELTELLSLPSDTENDASGGKQIP